MQTRTIILTGQGLGSLIGVLSIYGDKNISVNMKIYNVINENKGDLAFCIGEKVYIARDVNLSKDYGFEICDVNINDKMMVCLFDKSQNAILSNNLSDENISSLKKQLTAETLTHGVYSASLDENQTENGFEQAANNGHNFFETIAGQFENMLNNGVKCEEVEKLIPNSQWVFVDCEENDEKAYIIGRIFDDAGDTQYVCYGVPAQNIQDDAQTDTRFSQWLPLDGEDPNSNGYFIMYQDAKTGENIKFSA